MTTNRPLVYFANNTDYTREYTSNNPINKLAVFVGDAKKIYTHGVEFDGNNTTYSQATSDNLGLIKIGYIQNEKNYPVQLDSNGKAYVNVNWSDTDTIYDDSEIRQDIVDVEGLLLDLRGDLEGIHNWTADEVQDQVKSLLNDADWLNGWIEAHNIQTGEPFTFSDFEDDLGQYLIGIGVLEEYDDNGETKTRLGWSQLQASYDSLALSVQQLEHGGVDEEALKAELKQYIDNDTAVALLETMYSKVNENGDAIDWMISGLKALAGENETFVNLWSASLDAISGLTTRVQTLENGDYITTSSIGSYAPSLDAFSGLSSRVQTVEGNVSAMADFGSRIGSVESGLLTVTSTANGNSTAIANLFATNGAGTAAILAKVSDAISNLTLSADKITLDGTTWADTIFADWITANGIVAHELHIAGYDSSVYSDGAYLIDIDNNFIRLYGGSTSALYVNAIEVSPFRGIQVGDQQRYFSSSGGELNASLVTQDGLYARSRAQTSSGDHYYYEYTDITPKGIGIGTTNVDGSTEPSSYTYTTQLMPSGINTGYLYTTTSITNDGTTTLNSTVSIKGKTTFTNDVEVNDSHTIKVIESPAPGASYTAYISGTEMRMLSGTTQTVIISSGGSIRVTDKMYATAFEQTSDRNLKDIVSDSTLTVEQVANAPAVNFTWKKDAEDADKKQNVGTIAQYWQVVLPEVVGEGEDGTLTMQYSNAAMISAIATAKEVVALKQEIAELKRQIAELKAN